MQLRAKSDPSTSRAVNRRLILNLLRRHGALSRSSLVTQTGLSAPAVTSVVGELIGEGVVVEGASTPGALGRRPVPIRLNYGGRVAIGIKLMVGAIECVATDLSTAPLASVRLPVGGGSPGAFVEAIVGSVAHLRREPSVGAAPVVGMGVSLPGVIDARSGVCRRSERLGWTDVPLASMTSERIGVPVWLEDDTNAFALAQHLFGLGRDHQNMAALAIGAGIACSMVVAGKLYRGGSGAAGKLGHVVHDESGPLCECGRRGCLQASFAERALVAAWERGTTWTGERGRRGMLAATEAGDPIAGRVLAEAGEAIGRHLATFVNVMDPEIIVVGGEAVAFGDALFGPLRSALARLTFQPSPTVHLAWDDASWARGAAALATQQVFDFEEARAFGS